jgi:hypothetical protein
MNREPAVRFFFDDRHLTMDTLTLKTCLMCSRTLETLEVISRNSRKHYKGLSSSARIEFGAETVLMPDSAAVYVAKIGLSIPELAVVQFPEPVTGSALHHVAEAIVEFVEFGDNVFIQEWLRLGVDIIRNGADLCLAKKRDRWWSHLTPLLVILNNLTFWQSSSQRIRPALRRWGDMLKRANVDLEWYCAKESEAWKTHVSVAFFGRNRSFTCTMRLVKVQFCHETQNCILVFRDEFSIPLMRLRRIPGSFNGSQYPVETICWEFLSKEEEEEGHWSRCGDLVIGNSHTYEYDPEQEFRGWYNKLIDCTQDDNGTLLRMTRPPRNVDRSNKRASSQPPSQHRTRHDEEIMLTSRTHTWLPRYHYCHVRCTWTVSCHHGRLENWMDACMSKDPRLCVYQEDNDEIGNYPLEGTNFLGDIRQCKTFQYGFGDPQHHPLLRHSHRIRCAQGCDQVDLKKLAKPRDLPHWHPCRNEL